MRKHSKNVYPKLRKKAWDLQSKAIRREEKGVCFSCGKKNDWKLTDCGHFIHKNCLDFTRRNLHCQCTYCNRFLHGNLANYGIALEKKYGYGVLQELKKEGDKIRKFTIKELNDIIKKYE
jgi:hypothetical protein